MGTETLQATPSELTATLLMTRVGSAIRNGHHSKKRRTIAKREHKVFMHAAQNINLTPAQMPTRRDAPEPSPYETNCDLHSLVTAENFELALGLYHRCKNARIYFNDSAEGSLVFNGRQPNDIWKAAMDPVSINAFCAALSLPNALLNHESIYMPLLLASYLDDRYVEFLDGEKLSTAMIPRHVANLYYLWIKRRFEKTVNGTTLVPLNPPALNPALPLNAGMKALKDLLKQTVAVNKRNIDKLFRLPVLAADPVNELQNLTPPTIAHKDNGQAFNTNVYLDEVASSYYYYYYDGTKDPNNRTNIYNVSGLENPGIVEYLAMLCSTEMSTVTADPVSYIASSKYKDFKGKFRIPPALLRMVYGANGHIYTSTETMLVVQQLQYATQQPDVNGMDLFQNMEQGFTVLNSLRPRPTGHFTYSAEANQLTLYAAIIKNLPLGSILNANTLQVYRNMIDGNGTFINECRNGTNYWTIFFHAISLLGFSTNYTLQRMLAEETYNKMDIVNYNTLKSNEEPIMVYTVVGNTAGKTVLKDYDLFALGTSLIDFTRIGGVDISVQFMYNGIKYNNKQLLDVRDIMPVGMGPEYHDDVKSANPHLFISVDEFTENPTNNDAGRVLLSPFSPEHVQNMNAHIWIDHVPSLKAAEISSSTSMSIYASMSEDHTSMTGNMAEMVFRVDMGKFSPSEFDEHYDRESRQQKHLFGAIGKFLAKTATTVAGLIPVVGPVAKTIVGAVTGADRERKSPPTERTNNVTAVDMTNGNARVVVDLSQLVDTLVSKMGGSYVTKQF